MSSSGVKALSQALCNFNYLVCLIFFLEFGTQQLDLMPSQTAQFAHVERLAQLSPLPHFTVRCSKGVPLSSKHNYTLTNS